MRRWMQDDDAPRQAPWMNTYADMVTLLLCFFVLLFSMSVIEIEKFQSVMSSLQGALGILDGGTIPSPEGRLRIHFDPGDLVAQLLMQEMAQMTELQHAIEEEAKRFWAFR